jgi:hypothetical protein
MVLQLITNKHIDIKFIERYKTEGIIKKFGLDNVDYERRNYEDFEWINKFKYMYIVGPYNGWLYSSVDA